LFFPDIKKILLPYIFFLDLHDWLRLQHYIVELSHRIYSYGCFNVIYIFYVNLAKLSFDPLTMTVFMFASHSGRIVIGRLIDKNTIYL